MSSKAWGKGGNDSLKGWQGQNPKQDLPAVSFQEQQLLGHFHLRRLTAMAAKFVPSRQPRPPAVLPQS
jgi:hypothetical protein